MATSMEAWDGRTTPADDGWKRGTEGRRRRGRGGAPTLAGGGVADVRRASFDEERCSSVAAEADG